MLKTIFTIAALALSVIFAGLAAGAPNMQDGKWEITTKIEMEGLPVNMPPQKHTICMTKQNAVPQKQEKSDECKMTENRVVGDTVYWTVQCHTKDGSTEGKGKITYKGNSFDGIFTMTGKQGGEKINMKNHMSGKRIGECK